MSLWLSHWPKNPQPNFKANFFILNYMTPLVTTGNSSLAQSAAELWLPKVCPERANYAFSEKFSIRPKTGILTHNFGYKYVSKSIKGSTGADFNLVFKKTLSQKNGSMDWGPGPAKCGQSFQNMPSLWRHLQKSPHRKRKRFLFDLATRLAESVDGLDSSLAHSPGEL